MSLHNRSQVLEALCRRAEAYYNRKGLPFVTVTYAQSLDGSIAGSKGEPIAISSEESLVYTHALRARHDGILVGINTILSDNPALSTRLVTGTSPRPIVLDSRLRIPLTARVLRQDNPVRPIVFTLLDSGEEKRQALRTMDVCVIELPADSHGLISLEHMLPRLGKLGIKSLMVEGGGKVITSFIQTQCVNHLIVTVSMKMVGGITVLDNSLSVNGHPGKLPISLDLSCMHWEGADMILHGDPVWQT